MCVSSTGLSVFVITSSGAGLLDIRSFLQLLGNMFLKKMASQLFSQFDVDCDF